MTTTSATARVTPVTVHAFFVFRSQWHAITDDPIAVGVADQTYRRACGRLRRLLEGALGAPVELVERVTFDPGTEARVTAFRGLPQQRANLEARMRAEARELVSTLRPVLPMTIIARELGLTISELYSFVRETLEPCSSSRELLKVPASIRALSAGEDAAQFDSAQP